MLKSPTEFPQVGSYARAEGVRGVVRIQRRNSDGTVFVTGTALAGGATLSIDKLRAARVPKTVARAVQAA